MTREDRVLHSPCRNAGSNPATPTFAVQPFGDQIRFPKAVKMSWLDPMSSEDLNNLARRSKAGERLSSNEQYELDRAIKSGNRDVNAILNGSKKD